MIEPDELWCAALGSLGVTGFWILIYWMVTYFVWTIGTYSDIQQDSLGACLSLFLRGGGHADTWIAVALWNSSLCVLYI